MFLKCLRPRNHFDDLPRYRRLSHFSQCSRGPTPARSRSATSRLARAAGAIHLQCLSSGNHFDDFPCYSRLSDLVHVQRQLIDHLRRVAGRGIHRRHARGVLGRGRLEQGAKHLNLDVRWQQCREEFLRRRFVEILDNRLTGGSLGRRRLALGRRLPAESAAAVRRRRAGS